MNLATWIGIPVLGALIGYATNRIAVKMIFRPVRPVYIFGFRIQGLIGRRQAELARSIGAVVSDHLVQHDDVIRSFEAVDLEALLSRVMDRALVPKVREWRKIPLVGGLLTESRVTDLQKALVDGILKRKQLIFEELEQAVETGLDIEQVVTDRVASFPVERLEELVLEVADRELRTIEALGGLLGLVIGFLQVLLFALTR